MRQKTFEKGIKALKRKVKRFAEDTTPLFKELKWKVALIRNGELILDYPTVEENIKSLNNILNDFSIDSQWIHSGGYKIEVFIHDELYEFTMSFVYSAYTFLEDEKSKVQLLKKGN